MIVYDLKMITNGDQPIILFAERKILFEGKFNYMPTEYMRRLVNHVGIGFNRFRASVLTIEIL